MVSLVPKWPFVVAALVLGLLVGAYAGHKVMQARADKAAKTYAEELAARAKQYATDVAAARAKEQTAVAQVGIIEQVKTNEIAKIRAAAAADVASLRNRQDRKPAPASGLPAPAPACAGSTGAELSRADAGFLVGEAARADEIRTALVACYGAYDAASK